ncbi:MAG: YidC/Oxa1 family insertase periplasmic-domain containing protein [Planctomycetota bacterium]|jgi:YidC/Oxa1 family membrane protein insertase
MNPKIILALFVICFCIFCGAVIVDSGLFQGQPPGESPCILLQKTANSNQRNASSMQAEEKIGAAPKELEDFSADNAPAQTIFLGADEPKTEDPETGFKFQLELSSKGAAVKKATFSDGDGKGFDDCNYKNPQPLVILSPVNEDILSMANKEFIFIQQRLQLTLDKLHWQSDGVEKDVGWQSARFETLIKDKATGRQVIKLTKTYTVTVGSYMIDCSLTVENLSNTERKIRFNMAGPAGIGREGARADMRKVVGGFRNAEGQVTSTRLDVRKFDGGKAFEEKNLVKNSDKFLWAAVTNKYFAAILVPSPEQGRDFPDWVTGKAGRFYNPDGRKNSEDENLGVNLRTGAQLLAAAGRSGSSKQYNFQMYLGPKDKPLFSRNEQYKKLGFIEVIDFMACCCPKQIISPLAFAILGTMGWLYEFIPNYGVIIIIIVFLIRLVLHPITKKSQISMSKMQKLGPKVAELKKKYASNKAELQKQTMALYREQGASPIMGFLPMLVQMPIWISLYSAIYASVALRGAAFLPFWITDLSAPDALFRFSAIKLPIFGKIDSFNLLPILMGVAFYLQQKLMPKPPAAGVDPQVAQQQKMMMIMMPLLFPLMLYKAPSGLNLYIMASTFAGVVEQYVIRKHIREKEEAESMGLVAATSKTGGKVKKKKPKPFYRNF